MRGRLYDLGPYPALIDLDDPAAGWVEGYVRAVEPAELEPPLRRLGGRRDRACIAASADDDSKQQPGLDLRLCTAAAAQCPRAAVPLGGPGQCPSYPDSSLSVKETMMSSTSPRWTTRDGASAGDRQRIDRRGTARRP